MADSTIMHSTMNYESMNTTSTMWSMLIVRKKYTIYY